MWGGYSRRILVLWGNLMRRLFTLFFMVGGLMLPARPAMALTQFTYLTEQLISDTVNGVTTGQQALPAAVDCIDVRLVSAAWDSYAGTGTFTWSIERLQQGQWIGMVAQGAQPLGIRGKNGVMPQMGICRTGLGALQTRVRFKATVPVTVGFTGLAT